MPKYTAVSRLSDDEIVALVQEHGTVFAAERAIGVGRNCLQGQIKRRGLRARVEQVRRVVVPLTSAEKSARHRAAHLEERRAAGREWYHANKDVARERNRRWAQANPEKVRELSRRKMQRDPQRYREIAKRTYEKNRAEVLRLMGLRYSVGSRRATPESQAYVAILKADPCSYCGAPCQHLDHIDPLSRGGDATWDNLTAACASCNTSKGDRPLLTFLLARLPAA